MEKLAGEDEFSFGRVKFEVPIRHSDGDNQVGKTSLRGVN